MDSLGGKPQAMVIGTRIVTSTVNAALANGMAAHADETDDTNPASGRCTSAAARCRRRSPPPSSPDEPARTSCAR